MSRIILLAGAVAFAAVPSWTVAEAQVTSQSVPNCASPYTSPANAYVEQDQIVILGDQACSGRFIIHVTFSVDAQHPNELGSKARISILPIIQRQGAVIINVGPNECGPDQPASDTEFNTTNLSCNVSHFLPGGIKHEYVIRYFTDATDNARMKTWVTFEPGS